MEQFTTPPHEFYEIFKFISRITSQNAYFLGLENCSENSNPNGKVQTNANSLFHVQFFILILFESRYCCGEWAVDESVGYNNEDRKLKSNYQLSIHVIFTRCSHLSAEEYQIGDEKRRKKNCQDEHKYEA